MPDTPTDTEHNEEAQLRSDFDTIEESVNVGGATLKMLRPAAPDEMIDVTSFNTDERLPYWADLWPAARVLASWLISYPPPERHILELGCGLALPSLVLQRAGYHTFATDYYSEALRFARVNAARNGFLPPETDVFDWRDEWHHTAFPLVLAADVLYERRKIAPLVRLLPQVTEGDGRVLLADPGRTYLSEFLDAMDAAGWEHEQVGRVRVQGGGTVHIIQFQRAVHMLPNVA